MKSGISNGASALAVALVLSTSAAMAQDAAAPQENVGLQDIVVTAQKRSESAQQVPIAISAVTSEALQSKGLTDIASISGQAPNVTLKSSGAFGGSSSTLFTYIRGIGQNDFGFNLEPGVGVYVDNVYLARNIGANVDLLDLQRVEVLKGPQGTLFGRNTIGGALNIVTSDPGDEWKVKGEVTTGRYDRIDVRGALEAPLAPGVLHMGLAFSTKHRDGWQKRIPYEGDTGNNPIWLLATGGASGGPANGNTDGAILFPTTAKDRPDRSGNMNQTAVRLKFLFTPNDRLTMRLIGDYLNVDEQATPFSLLAVNQNAYVALYNTCISGNPAFYAPVAALAGVPAAGVTDLCQGVRGNAGSPAGIQPSLESQAGQNLPYDNRYVIRNADGSINPDLSYASGANYNKIDNYGINGQIDYDLTDALTIKSITAYRRLKSKFGADIGGAPFSALAPTFADWENQLSQEVQLVGNIWENRWKFVLGGYYFHEYGRHADRVPFIGGMIQIVSNDRYDTKSYAAFMHNNIDVIPDRLGLTLGIRYTRDDKRFTGTQRDENAFGLRLTQAPPALVLPDPNDIYRVYPLGENSMSFENVSYRIGAEYHINRRVMAYASYATGYKGGGWTTRLTLPNFTVVNGVPVKLPAPTFGPEKAYTTEIGIKSELFDRRVRLNVAAFNTEYNSIQLTFQNGSSPVTANGGDGRIRGVEAELNLAPVRNWTLDASLGYLDAEYQSILPGVPLTGKEKFVNTPKWQAQAGTAYTFETSGIGSFTPRVDWTYASKTYNDEANTPVLATPAGSFFNGSVTWRAPGERYEIQAGVTNIADRRAVVSGYTNAEAIYSGVFSRPREWFLTLRVRN
ncbi:TonB-dependent receptor [Sphingobium fuliginis]|jgi:iron complex outermembrane receptor protein|uniref:TonB-dependent receptor n=1 Tax=Sphingobium fuliginis (strain ATCC 27551) TaxID=336203 RepID=A0A7M2GP08_SPHSA|nr:MULTISPECIES: TonB-dependent receptor [Sphingobium]AJR23851.1 TonB-dependent receptor [Sphingobium sp. YBL2]QOT73609.1 TonB-dependent receptor [Sphingobium fuliginis]